MLQNIRQNIQGPTTKIVVWLIVISFSIFGIESILLGGGGGGIAEVNGEDISPQELQQAIYTQKRRLIATMGENIDPSMLDDEKLKGPVINSLVARKLQMQSAESMGLTVSKREIGALIGSMEQFQIEGVFSPQLFTSVLSSAGFTPAYFKESLADDVILTQLRSGLIGSEFATPLELAVNARVDAEQRDLQFLTVPMQPFIDDSSASDAEIVAYYEANQDDFRSTESVELDYIEIGLDQFRKPVEEDALLEAYQLEITNTEYRPENRVSHILFEQKTGEDDAAFQQRIAAAQAKLADGADFAKVAKEFSDDVGSASNGGDLGYSSGDAFPPEMEQAVAGVAVGEISAPVTTEAGTHLILVTERKDAQAPDLEELRPRLEEQLQVAEARVELLRTVEELRDLVFNAEGLEAPARELDLEVTRSDLVLRDQSQGLFSSPALLAAAFSEEVLEAGHNSDVIELGADKFLVLRVAKHNPPRVLELEEVREKIAALVAEQSARLKVAAEAQRIVEALAGGANIEQLATEAGYTWRAEPSAERRNTLIPSEVMQRAFAMPAPEPNEVLVDFVMTPAGDAQVISLAGVTPGRLEQMGQAAQMTLQQRLGSEYASLLNNEYQRGLRDSADIAVM